MDPRLERAAELGRAIVHETRTEKVTFLAGSLAYHAFISLLPLLVLLLVAITSLGNQPLEKGFLELVRALLSPGGSDAAVTDLFVEELRSAGQSTGVSAIGVAVLVWGTMRIFRGLDTAFSDIYETEAENTFVDQLSDGLVVLIAFGAAVVVAGTLQRLIPADAAGLGWRTAQFLLLVGGLSLTLYPMYYVFPDTDVSTVEVVPGTLFAAVGLTTLESLFRLYMQYSGSTGDSNVIAGILALLTWLYFTSLVILLGVVLNAVLSNRSADVNVRPVFGSVAPTASAPTPARSALADSLTRVNTLLSSASSVAITVDDETVPLPPPQTFETDTERDLLELGGGRFGLELRWSVAADDESESTPPAAAGSSSTDAAVDGDDGRGDDHGDGQGNTPSDTVRAGSDG